MTADPRATLVVGAGQAAVSLVTELRALGDSAPVVMIGTEPEPPYERPLLSKGYLLGERDRASFTLWDTSSPAAQGISLITGDTVVDVQRDERGGRATTSCGRKIDFARLALVTGAREALLPVDGAGHDGVLTLRTVADANRLAAALRGGTLPGGTAREGQRPVEVVVVGGGFIGLEVAASARTLGASVTVVEAADRVLSRSVTPLVSRYVAQFHESRGTRVLLGATVVRIHGATGRAEAVVLTDGTELSADLVVVGVGALPRSELAAAMGLTVVRRGIVVDDRARTSDGVTVAAGDVTIGPNPYAAGVPGLVRLESVSHATEQARVAAATLLGHHTAYTAVPWFWSDQGDLRLQIAGLPQGADETVLRGEPGAGSFSVLSYRGEQLIAAESVVASADYLAVKRALEKGLTVPADVAGNSGTPLKRLLRPASNASPS
ncbi:MAG: FAD-dependent oxidoreductase [Humibacillus sp.]